MIAHLTEMINFWIVFGLIGQFCFSMRFIVQWIVSEKQRQSVIPLAFWIFSLAGSSILLVYAIHLKDPVFILGQSFGLIVYIRNLQLIHQKTKAL
jgi:lipid-A-disaccharide synthase-like uncharacterized protein